MSDKGAASGVAAEDKKKAVESKPKKTGAPKKKTSALESLVAEAKTAYKDLTTTGDRQLRKRPQSATSAAPKKVVKKPAAPKKAKSKPAAPASSAESS